MDLSIDATGNFAHIKLSGQLDRDTILGAFDQAVSDQHYREGMGRLWDFTDADLSSLDTGTITEMAQYSLRFPPGINDVKVAFVTGRDLEYGLSRLFEMSSNANTKIQVFRVMDEARTWITGDG